jgi:hypothetical protein
MCIIIHKPAGIKLERYTYENCWSHHSDGAGFLVAKNGTLIMKKGFFTLKELLDALAPYAEDNCVIHFRAGTMGGRNVENCHPFLVNETLGFVHNGTINKIDRKENRYSDTWHFNELLMKPLVQTYGSIWAHKTVKYLIEEYIGMTNKLAFMNNEGIVKIYNEEKGTRELGCWFSNTDFRYYRGVRGHSTPTNFQSGSTGSASGNTSTLHETSNGFDNDKCVACDNCCKIIEKTEAKIIIEHTVCVDCYEKDPTVKFLLDEALAL